MAFCAVKTAVVRARLGKKERQIRCSSIFYIPIIICPLFSSEYLKIIGVGSAGIYHKEGISLLLGDIQSPIENKSSAFQ